MKANEAPDKIWMDLEWISHFDCKDCITEDSIEYIRKDVFIEKAYEYLNKTCRRFILTERDIEDFRNYMKGE